MKNDGDDDFCNVDFQVSVTLFDDLNQPLGYVPNVEVEILGHHPQKLEAKRIILSMLLFELLSRLQNYTFLELTFLRQKKLKGGHCSSLIREN